MRSRTDATPSGRSGGNLIGQPLWSSFLSRFCGDDDGPANAQAAVTSAAVVIGVDRTGGLAPLGGAAAGADAMKAWLEADGYEVSRITDENGGSVSLAQVHAAVRGFVVRGTVDKLVIYFAGHGYLNGTSEIWLLSGAPDLPTEAINETTSVEMARDSNIKNVIFISDSCRSVPSTLQAQRVFGSSIFPNQPGGGVDCDIDHFFATKPGQAAMEMKFEDALTVAGLFTKVLQDAHNDPPRDEVELANGKAVVPSRWLKAVLPDRVDAEAQKKSIALTQRPQLRLESGSDAFLASARFAKAQTDFNKWNVEAPSPPWSVDREILGDMIGTGSQDGGGEGSGSDDFIHADRITFDRKGPVILNVPSERPNVPAELARFITDDVIDETSVKRFEDSVGRLVNEQVESPLARSACDASISVAGAAVRDAAANMHGPARSLSIDDAGTLALQLDVKTKGCSVALEFADRKGTVVAALRGYHCTIVASETGVLDLSYTPIETGRSGGGRADADPSLAHLRALVSAASSHGLLAIDRENAEAFGNQVRRLKRFDPTLGVIAALAYAGAGLRSRTQSVLNHSREDLGVDLFDIWMLAGAERSNRQLLPLCPMLTQSWSYLEARGVSVHPALANAGKLGGFWTTFSAGEMPAIMTLMKEGELA